MKKIITSVCVLLMMIFCSISVYAYTATEAADMLTFSEISFEENTAVTYDLAFIRKFKGFDVAWSVVNGDDVVSDTGKITRPTVGETPQNATIKATISLEGDSAQKTFDITVLPYQSEDEILEKVKYELTFDRLSGEALEAVSSDLVLPSTLGYGTHIIWSSSDNAILRIVPDGTDYKGIVSNAYFTDGEHYVFLTATIFLGDSFAEKQFYIHTKEQTFAHTYTNTISDITDKFEEEFLTKNNVLAIRNDLFLPVIDGATISYESSDKDVISVDGKVTRAVDSDKIVKFYVTFNNGFENTHKIYSLIVKAAGEEDISKLIEEDLVWVIATLKSSQSLGTVMTDLNLPSEGPNGTKIQWISSNPSVLTNDGTVTRQSADTTLTLTVKVYFAEDYRTDSVNVTVKAISGDVIGGQPTGGAPSGSGTTGISTGGFDVPAVEITGRYTDVPISHWAYNAIEYLSSEKIIDGLGDGLYGPNDLITREAFTKLLITAMDVETQMYNTAFVDIEESHWAYPYVSTATAIGIVKGIENDVFGTGKSITRQDICTLIHRSYYPTETATNTAFCNDYNDISEYARPAVAVMYNLGLLQGDDDGNFNPQKPATRAEVAMIFYRLLAN